MPPAEAHGATLRIVLVTGGIIQASSIVPIPPVVAGCLHRAIRAQAKAIRAAEARLTEIRGTLPYVLAALRRLGRCQENGGRKR